MNRNELFSKVDERVEEIKSQEQIVTSLKEGNFDIEEMPESNKEGYILKKVFRGLDENNTILLGYEYVEDPYYIPVNDGSDFLKAILYIAGMEVTEGLWYKNEDGDIWECIKSGVPTGFYDSEYFDVI